MNIMNGREEIFKISKEAELLVNSELFENKASYCRGNHRLQFHFKSVADDIR
ncbi:hypothetical protein [Pediococcus pentosaceus]|uniref:hypothetical protein n=1 Tax=Pediococcus pentosaceus TaxID=1255 RepID=UPI000258AD98|nr:hypothetical protein [Pediococcus pentosaceus]CCG89881.1 hypothetical protein PCPN_465 [Pediococcus pentosaceus IE-3]